MEAPIIKAIAPWFGGNRLLAPTVGEELAGCSWVGIPFAGGMPELLHIHASTIVVNDLHRLVVNLARIVASQPHMQALARRLSRKAFHPDELAAAQAECRKAIVPGIDRAPCLDAAEAFFVATWMSRSGHAGTSHEFTGKPPGRWQANGGDSNTRYRSAVRSLVAWHRVMCRCNFRMDDAFDFLASCKDVEKNGFYCDAPWPDAGQEYRHNFTAADQVRLRDQLVSFKVARVVVRFGDHPLIRNLYPENLWTWRRMTGRKQSNADSPEVLLINGPSLAPEGGLS